MPDRYRNNVTAKANTLAIIIREHGTLKFGRLCTKGHVAPSTLYNYMRILLDGETFTDITYEKGVFKVKKELIE